MDHYRKLQRPHLARWRRTLCPPLHESTSLAALLRHFRSVPGRVAAAVTPCRSQAPDKESRAFAPRYFILSPCTPKGGLQAARQILSRRVLHFASTTHPLQVCSDSTSLTLVSVSTGFSLLFRVRSIPHTSSEGSQPSETVPFAPVFVPHIVAPVTDSPRGIPIGMNVSGLYAPGVFLDSVPGHVVSAESAEPFGLVILAGSNPVPLHFIKEHPSAGPTLTPEALWPSAAIPPSCKRRSDLSTPLEPHPVRRLPRPTALPAHILRDSVRFAPRDSQDVEPAHTDARFRVLPGTTGITRPGQAKEDISITYYLPPSYLFVQDLLCGGPVLRRLSVNLCCRILMLCQSLNQIPGFPTAGLLWGT